MDNLLRRVFSGDCKVLVWAISWGLVLWALWVVAGMFHRDDGPHYRHAEFLGLRETVEP